MKVYYQNIRRLETNFVAFHDGVSSIDYRIVYLTETLLMFCVPGHNTFPSYYKVLNAVMLRLVGNCLILFFVTLMRQILRILRLIW